MPNNCKIGVFMDSLVKRIQHFFEEHAFGVCTRLGEKMGIATSSIRLFFIYASFLTFGSPVIVYLALAFIMNMRRHLRRRSTIWDY
jgi:phage shock protein PspC (stress-responsive transcriptional regulator)